MINRNNPGNIRRVSGKPWVGEIVPSPWVAGFVTFDTLEHGYRAMLKLLNNYLNAGYNTIQKIITRWAPPSENPTAAYIQFISDYTRTPAGVQITPGPLVTKIAEAISEFEHYGDLTQSDLYALQAAAASFTPGSVPSPQYAAMAPVLIALVTLGAISSRFRIRQ